MTQTSVFFIQALLVVGVPFLIWRALRSSGLVPLVVVQILAGLILGPSLLGQAFPEFWGMVFDPSRLSPLSGLHWLAVVLFSFLTGLHLDPDDLRGYGKTASAAAIGSVLVPLLMGALAGLWLANAVPSAVGANASPLVFALAVALCTAVTALPVMGAILREMELHDMPLGRLAAGCAAFSDAFIWVLLTCMLVAFGHGNGQSAVFVVLFSALYVLVMLFVVRPVLPHLLKRFDPGSEMKLAMIVVLIFASAFISEFIGLHYVFGGFMAGIVLPRRLAGDIGRQLEPTTIIVLLPFFFLMTGLRTEVGLGDSDALVVFIVGTAAAVIGKIVGTSVPCLLTGLPPREAWAMGALMQTKGLMEIVILAILMDAGIVGSSAFSGLLLMALTTTIIAKPLTSVALRVRDIAPGSETGR